MDLLTYFRAEIDTVGRHWRDILAAFDDDTARRRPAPNMNHVLWLTGHMTWAEDYLILEVPKGLTFRRKDWDRLFDHSSEKLSDDQYPSFADVKNEYTRVHAEVVKHLALMSPADLARASTMDKRWLPTSAHAIAHQVTHGQYHLGQLMYVEKLRQAGKL
ncbi:MAG: DinB family protein [Planctomycetota bacterium]|nr:DinB family protein [Planctomycetota bacterium]